MGSVTQGQQPCKYAANTAEKGLWAVSQASGRIRVAPSLKHDELMTKFPPKNPFWPSFCKNIS